MCSCAKKYNFENAICSWDNWFVISVIKGFDIAEEFEMSLIRLLEMFRNMWISSYELWKFVGKIRLCFE